MTVKKFTLNGAVFNPSKIETTPEKKGEVKEMIDGTTRFFYKSTKRKWTITWDKIPDALVQSIRTIYLLTTAFTAKDEWDTSFTVLTLPGAFKHTLDATSIGLNGTEYFDVTLEIQEV